LRADIDEAIHAVITSGKFTLGPQVEAFEAEFAQYCGVRFGVGVSNGTEALRLALLCTDVGPGHEVIVPANSYIATAFAVTYTGAEPIFVDVDKDTFNLDIDAAAAAITPRTRAIIPVHMYGQMVDMDALRALAEKFHLLIIEDAAHAHGAEWAGKRAGSLGRLGCFSFYPTKNLGCYGDGGIVVTDDETACHRLRRLRYMGQTKKNHSTELGYQQRLDEIQAAILRVKLRHLAEANAARRAVASRYDRGLESVRDVARPVTRREALHCYYQYTIQVPRRDELAQYLADHGIQTMIHYPLPIPLHTVYGRSAGAWPRAEWLSQRLVCLPMFPELTDHEVQRVLDSIASFFQVTGHEEGHEQ
jgi:dTDP-4-amino-4,6-dideoxygalactose transaminase